MTSVGNMIGYKEMVETVMKRLIMYYNTAWRYKLGGNFSVVQR